MFPLLPGSDDSDTSHILQQLGLLSDAALPLVRQCKSGLSVSVVWLEMCNKSRHRKVSLDICMSDKVAGLRDALDDFRTARLAAIEPYRHIFDPAHSTTEANSHGKLKHRGLFQVFVAHYHLIEFAESLLRLLCMLEDFDKARQTRKFWYPRLTVLVNHLRSSHTEARHLATAGGQDEEEGDFADDEEGDELGEVKKRNPEHIPFESPLLNVVSKAATIPNILRARSFTYAVKAAVLTALTTLPQFIASSAAFYYYNRGIWCAIMAQLTLAMYSGDTTAAWLGRCVASFWGAVCGMVVWWVMVSCDPFIAGTSAVGIVKAIQ